MAKKSKKKRTKSSKKTQSWEDIGKMIGKKIEKEGKPRPWVFHAHSDKGFFGRVLFAIMLVWALNIIGVFSAVPTWMQVLMVVGFAFMRF